MPKRIPQGLKTNAFIEWLAAQRNDLETPAIALSPGIADVLAAIKRLPNAKLTRMSGSGATCFGLFDTEANAQSAAKALSEQHPDWWVGSYKA